MLPANLAKTRAAGRGAYGELLMLNPGHVAAGNAASALRYAPYPIPVSASVPVATAGGHSIPVAAIAVAPAPLHYASAVYDVTGCKRVFATPALRPVPARAPPTLTYSMSDLLGVQGLDISTDHRWETNPDELAGGFPAAAYAAYAAGRGYSGYPSFGLPYPAGNTLASLHHHHHPLPLLPYPLDHLGMYGGTATAASLHAMPLSDWLCKRNLLVHSITEKASGPSSARAGSAGFGRFLVAMISVQVRKGPVRFGDHHLPKKKIFNSTRCDILFSFDFRSRAQNRRDLREHVVLLGPSDTERVLGLVASQCLRVVTAASRFPFRFAFFEWSACSPVVKSESPPPPPLREHRARAVTVPPASVSGAGAARVMAAKMAAPQSGVRPVAHLQAFDCRRRYREAAGGYHLSILDLTNGQLTPNNNTPLLTQALSGNYKWNCFARRPVADKTEPSDDEERVCPLSSCSNTLVSTPSSLPRCECSSRSRAFRSSGASWTQPSGADQTAPPQPHFSVSFAVMNNYQAAAAAAQGFGPPASPHAASTRGGFPAANSPGPTIDMYNSSAGDSVGYVQAASPQPSSFPAIAVSRAPLNYSPVSLQHPPTPNLYLLRPHKRTRKGGRPSPPNGG
ncbi:hypothetical protein GEV33_013673 [Tenebrio molitor]|uniref:Uncharacterized protein n=1 Tax=Tenebrio molitor TaxID=7067 RepID=A0A8J6H6Q1_TENMO|nr:hypothetical protein GEV33_013673 [Tenebrio molitor]